MQEIPVCPPTFHNCYIKEMKLDAVLWNLVHNMCQYEVQTPSLAHRTHRICWMSRLAFLPVLVTLGASPTWAQESIPDSPGAILIAQQSQPQSVPESGTQTPATTSSTTPNSQNQAADPDRKIQTKRILGVIPNYRSVSADTQLPPQSFKDKFWLATQDSFDYSSFILAGAIAGIGQAQNSYPEFHQGAAGYARYFWHSFADQAVGNYFTEAIVPALSREDSRYYTLGHGNFFHRSGYAVSRLFITRTDSGGSTFNFSEIGGNLAGAAVSNTYYPSRERTWTKTQQKWFLQVGLDGVFNVCKEFWPDINKAIFHQKY